MKSPSLPQGVFVYGGSSLRTEVHLNWYVSRFSWDKCSYVGAVLYQPDSVWHGFFDDRLADLDVITKYEDPTMLTGDFNLRLDRSEGAHLVQLRLLLDPLIYSVAPSILSVSLMVAVWLALMLRTPVSLITIFFSGQFQLILHLLLFTSMTIRPWKSLDIDSCRTSLSALRLSQTDVWPDCIDDKAGMYNDVLYELLN